MYGSVHVALDNPKFPHNIGAVIRGMSCFTDGGELVWTGNRVDPTTMDRIPREERMKAYANVPWRQVTKPTEEFPHHTPVVIELVPGAQLLPNFTHPEFGPEDGSVNPGIRAAAHAFVAIPSFHCMNLSVAVNMILYDRAYKRFLETGNPADMPLLAEDRGGWATNDFDLVARSA